MNRVLFLTIAFPAWFMTGVLAQGQPQTGYHSVTCLKVKDGKMAEARQFFQDNRGLPQVVVDSRKATAAFLLRSVMPAGEAARCDYLQVMQFPAEPPAPLSGDEISKVLQKAGISTPAKEFLARRDSMFRLVNAAMWRTMLSVGDMEKGDYVFVNHMKVQDRPNWMELERSVWKPMAESWVQDHSLRGWQVATPVLPSGTGLTYQAVTLDIMPSWEATFKPRAMEATFKQVHPDKDIKQVFEKFGKVRDLALRELVVVEDKITPSGGNTSKAPSGQ